MPATNDALSVRPMGEADLTAAHGLSVAVGWPHRLEDWRLALTLGEGVVGLRASRVAATALWWRYGASGAGARQGRIGLVIVAPSLQGAGLGRRLMEAGLEALGAQPVLLNATVAGAGLYRRLGFEACGEIVQHQGMVQAGQTRPVGAAPRVRALQAGDIEQITAMDTVAIGADRRSVLTALLAISDTLGLEADGALAGFALSRAFGRGRLIGPVVARDGAAARLLVEAMIARHAGCFVRIDVPAGAGFGGMLSAAGLAEVDRVVTMVRGEAPAAGAWHTFALANQALG
jgi:hypothetical protein